MSILDRIEARVALPGDSETRRSQKALSTMLLFVGAVFTLPNALTYLALGMRTAGIFYSLWVLIIVATGIAILVWPRLWLAIMSALTFGVILITLVTHVYSGGFQAGLKSAVWMLTGLMIAVLFISPRFAIVALAAYILGVIAAAYLEPFAQSIAPDLSLRMRMQIAAGNLIVLGVIITAASFYLLRRVDHYRRRADDLLHNMLPSSIALRLKEDTQTIADAYDDVTVLFADIVGSTPLFSDLEPAEAVDWLNEVFSMFDRQVEKRGLEKIRTIGDSYMVAAGAPNPIADHALAMADLALDLVRGLEEIPARHGKRMAFRFGINSGPVVAGVIGQIKYHYDIWGDTVNIASRMESHGEAGKIHISAATHDLLKDEFDCVSRGRIPIKGKGEMETWFLLARKEQAGA